MIPIGFRFEPTDEELIRGFLLPQVLGLELPWNGVIERKVYGDAAAPWVVFSDAGEPSMYWTTKKEGGATKNSTYVFTTLTRVPNSKRILRTAGGGTWSGQTGPKKIKNSDTGDVIGKWRMFAFESSKFDVTPSSELGHWIMHEYCLDGAALDATGLTDGCDLVICKITRCIKNTRGGGGSRAPLQPQFVLPNKRAAEDQEAGESCRKKHKSLDSDGEGFFNGAATEAVGDIIDGEGFSDAAATEAEGDIDDPDSWLISLDGLQRFLDGSAGTEGIIVERSNSMI